ncbi:hypothetical protein [Solihabitans fulvus]|uniref:hypothetical protein n=1 Tax=Solihabitans fulvus TaxID=1892852 RepID=UPI001CB75E94|nr:hypothetical protein [Solihabitans fulvus]
MNVTLTIPAWMLLAILAAGSLICALVLYVVTRLLVYRLGTEVETLAAQLVLNLNGTAPPSARACLSPRTPSASLACSERGRHAGGSPSSRVTPDTRAARVQSPGTRADGEPPVLPRVPAHRAPHPAPNATATRRTWEAWSAAVENARGQTTATLPIGHVPRQPGTGGRCVPIDADLTAAAVTGRAS